MRAEEWSFLEEGFGSPCMIHLPGWPPFPAHNFLLVILFSPRGVNTEEGKWEPTAEPQRKEILMKGLKTKLGPFCSGHQSNQFP